MIPLTQEAIEAIQKEMADSIYWSDSDFHDRKFVAYFHYVGWCCLSFGFHVCLRSPNIEIHLPTGFIRIGMVRTGTIQEMFAVRTWGIGAKD